MRTAIVVGSGAGGATVAKELQGRFDVLVLEAGREFRPLTMNLAIPERLKRLGLLFDERPIRLLFPAMKVQKTARGMVLVRGIGTGGTTTLATANALRLDRSLRALGVDLDEEFAELGREVPVSTAHRARWNETTRRLFSVFEDMGLEPLPMPKMRRRETCGNCGRCVLGCPSGAKWDSREFLRTALDRGARLATGCRVTERPRRERPGYRGGGPGRLPARDLPRGCRRARRRGPRHAGHSREFRHPLRGRFVRRSRPLRGRAMDRCPPG